MIKKNKIPTILGIVILVIGVFAGVFFLGVKQIFRIGADASVAPKDIRISNITDTSATISWTTDKETVGFLAWGESKTSTSRVEKEDDSKSFTHSVNISGLKPNTNYFYKINSEGSDFDNSGIPWQLTSGGVIGINQYTYLVSGSVITASGKPVKKALVYANISGYLLSTTTSDTGNFVFQLGMVRTQDLQGYAQIDESQTLIDISVQAGADGVASAQVFPKSASPIPVIILGQIYDFRNTQSSGNSQNPDANLNLPANNSSESKFNIATGSSTPASTSVILESLDEGEVVTNTKPEFFGKGPGGENITITVHSENPVTETVTIPKDGSWKWSPPGGLSPGSHSITISWIDATGITKILTRNFVVQASELPAFVSTPSGSPTATPKSTTPSATPKATATASARPVPVTGSLTPTLLLSIMGVAVLLFSFAIWKVAEN